MQLRRTLYLTIMSSASFEEAGHKLMKMRLQKGQEPELVRMIIDCCSQERTFLRFYALLAQRFCVKFFSYRCLPAPTPSSPALLCALLNSSRRAQATAPQPRSAPARSLSPESGARMQQRVRGRLRGHAQAVPQAGDEQAAQHRQALCAPARHGRPLMGGARRDLRNRGRDDLCESHLHQVPLPGVPLCALMYPCVPWHRHCLARNS